MKDNVAPYTTQTLKNAIQQMESEELALDAPIEVHIGDRYYHIKELGHFHVIPNMTIELELIDPSY